MPPGNRCGGEDGSTRQDTALPHPSSISAGVWTRLQTCSAPLATLEVTGLIFMLEGVCGCEFWGDRRCQVLELVRLPLSHGCPSPSRGLAALPTPTLIPTPVFMWPPGSTLSCVLLPHWLLFRSFSLYCSFFFFFSSNCSSCGILVPQPGIRSAPCALDMWSLYCWTTREVPVLFLLISLILNDWSPPGSVLGPLFYLHLHF